MKMQMLMTLYGILVVGQATTQQIQSEIVKIETDFDIVFEKLKLANDPCNYYGRNICSVVILRRNKPIIK
jgi:hypothetical protein